VSWTPRWAAPERRGEAREVLGREPHRTVIEGPFPESKQLIAGRWILQGQSMDEAVEWTERFPFEALSRIYPASTAPRGARDPSGVRAGGMSQEPGGWDRGPSHSDSRSSPQRLEAAGYQFGGAALRRRRRALPAGPAERFLLHKGLFVLHDEPADKRIQTEEFLATCMRHWSTLALLHRRRPDRLNAIACVGGLRCRRRRTGPA
jgi:YCII-related domain